MNHRTIPYGTESELDLTSILEAAAAHTRSKSTEANDESNARSRRIDSDLGVQTCILRADYRKDTVLKKVAPPVRVLCMGKGVRTITSCLWLLLQLAAPLNSKHDIPENRPHEKTKPWRFSGDY